MYPRDIFVVAPNKLAVLCSNGIAFVDKENSIIKSPELLSTDLQYVVQTRSSTFAIEKSGRIFRILVGNIRTVTFSYLLFIDAFADGLIFIRKKHDFTTVEIRSDCNFALELMFRVDPRLSLSHYLATAKQCTAVCIGAHESMPPLFSKLAQIELSDCVLQKLLLAVDNKVFLVCKCAGEQVEKHIHNCTSPIEKIVYSRSHKALMLLLSNGYLEIFRCASGTSTVSRSLVYVTAKHKNLCLIEDDFIIYYTGEQIVQSQLQFSAETNTATLKVVNTKTVYGIAALARESPESVVCVSENLLLYRFTLISPADNSDAILTEAPNESDEAMPEFLTSRKDEFFDLTMRKMEEHKSLSAEIKRMYAQSTNLDLLRKFSSLVNVTLDKSPNSVRVNIEAPANIRRHFENQKEVRLTTTHLDSDHIFRSSSYSIRNLSENENRTIEVNKYPLTSMKPLTFLTIEEERENLKVTLPVNIDYDLESILFRPPIVFQHGRIGRVPISYEISVSDNAHDSLSFVQEMRKKLEQLQTDNCQVEFSPIASAITFKTHSKHLRSLVDLKNRFLSKFSEEFEHATVTIELDSHKAISDNMTSQIKDPLKVYEELRKSLKVCANKKLSTSGTQQQVD